MDVPSPSKKLEYLDIDYMLHGSTQSCISTGCYACSWERSPTHSTGSISVSPSLCYYLKHAPRVQYLPLREARSLWPSAYATALVLCYSCSLIFVSLRDTTQQWPASCIAESSPLLESLCYHGSGKDKKPAVISCKCSSLLDLEVKTASSQPLAGLTCICVLYLGDIIAVLKPGAAGFWEVK